MYSSKKIYNFINFKKKRKFNCYIYLENIVDNIFINKTYLIKDHMNFVMK